MYELLEITQLIINALEHFAANAAETLNVIFFKLKKTSFVVEYRKQFQYSSKIHQMDYHIISS